LAGGEPIVDWDHPDSWNSDAAVAAVEELCRTGCTDAPVYDIALNSRTGHRVLDLGDSTYFLAEGIFAQEIVAACRERDLLADAVCVTQHPVVTFVRRLARDLREHRKPPFYLLRRGLHLLAEQRALVARAQRQGCRVLSPEAAHREITILARSEGGRP
ncbi:MAG: ATP-binding protein, partial [Marmoricola sp.]